MATIAELEQQISVLKAKLEAEKTKNCQAGRQKIAEMSSEVVDSNPYR